MTQTVDVRLTDVSQQLGINYVKLYRAVISGEIPAKRDKSGSRWVIAESDIPVVKEALGR